MSLSEDDVHKVAHLARLEFSDEEAERYQSELGKILDLVAQMKAVNTDDVLPMAHPLDTHQRLREDIVTEQDSREALQTGAPAVEAGLYLVPKVIE